MEVFSVWHSSNFIDIFYISASHAGLSIYRQLTSDCLSSPQCCVVSLAQTWSTTPSSVRVFVSVCVCVWLYRKLKYPFKRCRCSMRVSRMASNIITTTTMRDVHGKFAAKEPHRVCISRLCMWGCVCVCESVCLQGCLCWECVIFYICAKSLSKCNANKKASQKCWNI